MDYQYLNGVDYIKIGVVGVGGAAPSSWVRLEDIEDGSVSIAVNSAGKTRIRVEDNPGVRLTILSDADPDVFNFGTINLTKTTMQKLFGGRIDTVTGTYYMPAQQVIVRMAIQMATKLVNGVRDIFTFEAVDATATFNGNFTRGAVVSARVAADIIPFLDPLGNLVKCTIQSVDEDGLPVNDSLSTPTNFTITQLFDTQVSQTDSQVTTTVAAVDVDTKFEFDPTTPLTGAASSMVLKIGGASVATVDFVANYLTKPFRFTSASGVAYTGVFANGDVILSA